jgi:hypothetical protein
MAICCPHVRFHQEIFAIPGFLRDPILIMGVQDIFHGAPDIDAAFPGATVRDWLLSKGHADVHEVDLHDKRAEFQIDLAKPNQLPFRANTIIDIGTIEHVANPHAVLQNYADWLAIGGHLYIHTPVRGHCMHGLFTFAPEYIPRTLKRNGFEIVYEKYCGWSVLDIAPTYEAVTTCTDHEVLGWYVGRKLRDVAVLESIQQGRYDEDLQGA